VLEAAGTEAEAASVLIPSFSQVVVRRYRFGVRARITRSDYEVASRRPRVSWRLR